MNEIEKTKQLLSLIAALMTAIMVIAIVFIYDTYKSTAEIVRENEKLQRKIEYQQSVIADMEENLRRNLE